MKHLRNICLYPILVIIVGCNTSSNLDSQLNRDKLFTVWRSNEMAATSKADALNKFIPLGTDGDVVRDLLGSSAKWNRYHGPDIDIYAARQSQEEGHDFWTLEYPALSGEVIFLKFHQVSPGSGFHVQFDGAYVGKRL